MTDIRFSYKNAPTIKAFSESDKFMRGLMGPFGSGKSSGCVTEIITRSNAQAPGPDGIRRTRWAVIRNTYQQLRDTTIKTFHQWLKPSYFGEWYKSEHRYLITKFKGVEIEILFRALDRPDQVDNLLSLELTGAWFNEGKEIPWTIVKAMMGRVLRYPAMSEGGPTWGGIILDSNPPDTDSWWYRYFEEANSKKAAIFKQPSGLSDKAENLPNLVNGYYDNLAEGMDDEWVKVYVKGEYGFVIDGKAVYPEYKDTVHCKEFEIHKKCKIMRMWDFGLTPCAIYGYVDPAGVWRIFDEQTSDSMGIDRFTDDVLAHSSQNYSGHEFIDIGDPAGNQRAQTDEKTCFQIMQAKGIDIQPGKQTIALRLECVKKSLNTMREGDAGFQLHPRCKMTRKGFQGGYQFRRMMTSKEKYTEKPDKGIYSHPMNAVEYGATHLFADSLTTRAQVDEPIEYDDSWIV